MVKKLKEAEIAKKTRAPPDIALVSGETKLAGSSMSQSVFSQLEQRHDNKVGPSQVYNDSSLPSDRFVDDDSSHGGAFEQVNTRRSRIFKKLQ